MMDICFDLDAIYPFIDVFASAAKQSHSACALLTIAKRNQIPTQDSGDCHAGVAARNDGLFHLRLYERSEATSPERRDLYCRVNQPQDSPAPKYNRYARDNFGRYPVRRDW